MHNQPLSTKACNHGRTRCVYANNCTFEPCRKFAAELHGVATTIHAPYSCTVLGEADRTRLTHVQSATIKQQRRLTLAAAEALKSHSTTIQSTRQQRSPAEAWSAVELLIAVVTAQHPPRIFMQAAQHEQLFMD